MSAEQHDWMDRGNCLGEDPDLMQPEVASAEDVDEAKAVCAGCPVWLECDAWADVQGLGAYGVHAGKWWGEPPRRPGVPEVLSDEDLRDLFDQGMSIRKVAAEYGLTVKQVRTARARVLVA